MEGVEEGKWRKGVGERGWREGKSRVRTCHGHDSFFLFYEYCCQPYLYLYCVPVPRIARFIPSKK